MPKLTRELVDREITKVLSDPHYGMRLSSIGTTNFASAALFALQATLADPPASTNEKTICQSFLENVIGNMDFNQQIGFIIGDEQLTEVLTELRNLSYRTRHGEKIDELGIKINKLISFIINNEAINVNDRFSIAEFAMLRDLAKIKPFLEVLKQADILGNLSELYNLASKAFTIFEKLNENYQRSMIILPGSFALDDTQKKTILKNINLDILEQLAGTIITGHSHATRLSSTFDEKAKKQNIQISHINPHYKVEKFDLLDFLYSDIYKLELSKLISDPGKKILTEKFGERWLNHLNRMFKIAERKLHDDSLIRLAGLTALTDFEMRLAVAPSLMGKYLGHMQLSKTNFQDIHAKMYGHFYETQPTRILCSQFVAHTLIAALVEVNKELRNTLSVDKDIIQLPISPHEKLSIMHPDRLLAALKEKDCVRRIEGPASITKYINK